MPEKDPLFGQVVRFIAVGAAGLLVDVVVFNVLRLTVFSPHVVSSGPLLAKVVSVTAAIGTNWIGNRNWTFRETRRTDVVREGLEFAVVSIAGSLVAVLCLAVSHYALHLTSPLADNISANVIGLLLGTIVRFAGYRAWVFSARRTAAAAAARANPAAG